MKKTIFFIGVIFLFACRAKKERTQVYKLGGVWEISEVKQIHKRPSGQDSVVQRSNIGELVLATDNISSLTYPAVPDFNTAFFELNYMPYTWVLLHINTAPDGAVEWYGDTEFKRFVLRKQTGTGVIGENNIVYTILKHKKNLLELYYRDDNLFYGYEEFMTLKRKK